MKVAIKNAYVGHVYDRMNRQNHRKTRTYRTFQDAHNAAEKLCKKWLGERGMIDVEG